MGVHGAEIAGGRRESWREREVGCVRKGECRLCVSIVVCRANEYVSCVVLC